MLVKSMVARSRSARPRSGAEALVVVAVAAVAVAAAEVRAAAEAAGSGSGGAPLGGGFQSHRSRAPPLRRNVREPALDPDRGAVLIARRPGERIGVTLAVGVLHLQRRSIEGLQKGG